MTCSVIIQGDEHIVHLLTSVTQLNPFSYNQIIRQSDNQTDKTSAVLLLHPIIIIKTERSAYTHYKRAPLTKNNSRFNIKIEVPFPPGPKSHTRSILKHFFIHVVRDVCVTMQL